MTEPSEAEVAYWQGIMDGIATRETQGSMKQARKFAKNTRHVCYCSIIGPYCVICHRDMIDFDCKPIWSDDESLR